MSSTSVKPVERVLDRLEGVRESNGSWKGLCPAHDDRNPSLSVTVGNAGQALIHCHAGCDKADILEALGLRGEGLYPAEMQNGRRNGHHERRSWEIRDASGNLIAAHHRKETPEGKRVWWRGPNGEKKLSDVGLKVADLPLYRSEHVQEWPEDVPVVVVEGEPAADALADVYPATLATVTGAESGPGAEALEVVRGRNVILWPDADEPGRRHMEHVAKALQNTASEVRIFEWKEAPDKGDAADHPAVKSRNRAGVEELISERAESAVWEHHQEPPEAEDNEAGDAEENERKPTQAELLIRCAEGADLFHTPAGDSYATVPVYDHRETHPVKAKGFRRWLVRAFFEKYGRPPGNQALQDALGLLEARADFDGPEREVYVRTAEHGGNVYVDLANERWEVAEITPTGWRAVAGEDAPVRFRRPRGMLALPAPGARADDADGLLQRFFNVSQDEDLRLIVAWLVAALRPTGPYPVLLLQGEQGSAKSTAERLVRALVDPSAAPLRTTPRSEHDLYIAADNAHVLAWDNISSLQPWLSDALCRLSTGGGFSTRTLYENREEELFDGMKPVILNGITDVATRPDLLDRALVVSLPPIPDEKRRPEAELWREFEQARPAILAALFDAVSGALRSVEDVRLEGMPRMADFALWATAAEESLRWEPGAFMSAYTGNRQAATDTALDADPVAGAVLELMQDRDEWIGSATEMWTALSELVDEGVRHTKAWPGAPNALTGRLKRLAPTLRGVGIEYGEDRTGKDRSRKKRLVKNKPVKDRPHRPHRPPTEYSAQESQIQADSLADSSTGADSSDRPPPKDRPPDRPPKNRVDKSNVHEADSSDGADGDLQPYSNPSDDVRALLSDPPGWLADQVTHTRRQGFPERLLKPLAVSIATELYDDHKRAGDVLPVVEAELAHPLSCECEECL